MYKWKSWNNKIKKHLSLTSDASLMVIVFRMNQIKDVTDIFLLYVINCKNKCNVYSDSSSRSSQAVLKAKHFHGRWLISYKALLKASSGIAVTNPFRRPGGF